MRKLFASLIVFSACFLCLPGLNAQDVRVMQWNVEGNNGLGLGRLANNTNAQTKANARIINYNQPDILLFNEINCSNGLTVAQNEAALTDWITNNIPYLGTQRDVTFFVKASSASDGFIRNAVVSRYPIFAAGTYTSAQMVRGLHAFRVQLAGTNVLQVFQAHFKCCHGTGDCLDRQTNAIFASTTIRNWAATNSLPYIFAGDWNEDESNAQCNLDAFPTYRPITMVRTNGNLVEFAPTALNGSSKTIDSGTLTPTSRFDYCLAASNRLSAVSGYVFNSLVWGSQYTSVIPGSSTSDSSTASDHLCVFVTYSFPASGITNFNVTPAGTFASSGYQLGPFSPSSQVYTLTNSDATIPLFWSVTATSNWLSFAPAATNFTLGASRSITITASINSAASLLPPGTFTNSISFSNTATGVSLSRLVSLSVVSLPPPSANFTGAPTNGVELLSVTFTNTSTGSFTNSFWDFGDGMTLNAGAATNLVHSYAAGTYDVTLVVSGLGGVSTNTKSNYLTVMPAFQGWQIQYFGSTTNPAAASGADPDGDGQNNLTEFLAGMDPTNSLSRWSIQANPTNGLTPQEVNFTDNSTSSSITNWSWDFGDGGVSNGTNNPSHTYTNAGTFSVGLTIFNRYGSTTLVASNLIHVLPGATIAVLAYDLQDRFGTLMPPSGVAVLVADTGANEFVDPQPAFPLSLGATWGTDDRVVGLWDLTAFGDGYLDVQTVVVYTNGVAPGQPLQLYWFPSLTLASNTVGVTYYGKYTDTNSPPLDGSAPWNLPAAGESVGLIFLTANEGGSNSVAAGQATNLTTLSMAADFTASPTNGVAPLTVAFTDTSTGSPTNWAWNFGDAGTSTLQNPSHNYPTAGVYTVQLIAGNAGGSSTNAKTAYLSVISVLQSWLNHYGVAADSADADGDGLTNTNEFLAGFNPTNGAAYPRIINIVKSGSDMNITYLGANGDTNYPGGPLTRTNVLECALVPAGGSFTNSFVGLKTNWYSNGTGRGTNVMVADEFGATNQPARYYRLRVLVP